MKVRSGFRARLVGGAAVALAGLLASSGLALADTETGQHGHYVFPDAAGAGVTCVYAGSGPYRLVGLVVKPPSLWWWDADSSNNREHGRVGWRALVQVSTQGAYGPFATVAKTTLQKAIAYEDHPLYDPADKAPLTKQKVSFQPGPYKGNALAYVSVTFKAMWYRPSGKVAGSVTHYNFNYHWRNVSGTTASTNACPIWDAPG